MERIKTRSDSDRICPADGKGLCNIATEALTSLAAYEDTGLTSDEIDRILDAYGHGMTLRMENAERLRLVKDISTDRLIELAQAEKDRRLVVLPEVKATWIKAILAERDRQDRKWGRPQENTYCEWSSILAEEVGELAQELNELNFGRGDQGRMELEAVQVAAVALAILEQSGVAQRVTVQAAVALGRVTSQVDERMGKEG